jgi:hypothetical protein
MNEHESHQHAVDNAWKIHGAVSDWTRSVDAKASFVLTIEVALLAGVVSMMGGSRRLAHLHGFWRNVLLYGGIAALVVALVSVAWVVRPRTRKNRVEQEAPRNFIYFGHLNFLRAEDVQRALEDEDILPVLSRQLVTMGRIAWDKHNLLKWSLTAAMLGTALVGGAAALA